MSLLFSRSMDGHHSKRTRHNKSSKSSRKSRPISLQPIISGEIAAPFHHSLNALIDQSAGNPEGDRLNDIIDDMTSENDEVRVHSLSRLSTRSSSSRLVEPSSPQLNENHQSLYVLPSSNDTYRKPSARPKRFPGKEKRGENRTFSPLRPGTSEDRVDSSNRRKSIGELRRDELTDRMEFYRHCLESAQNSYPLGINDDPTKNERRQEYTTALW